MAEQTWETEEVCRHLLNDEAAYNEAEDIVRGCLDLADAAEALENWIVTDRNGPRALYDSIESPPASSWDDVDWEQVAQDFYEDEDEEPQK